VQYRTVQRITQGAKRWPIRTGDRQPAGQRPGLDKLDVRVEDRK
jgi:hypothetical protein